MMFFNQIKKSSYAYSIIVLSLCMLLLAPSTVYASETPPPAFSVVQPLTGSAIPASMLSSSLVESLNIYLVQSYVDGNIDIDHYNEFLNSGIISETAFFENTVFVGDSLTVGFKDYCTSNPEAIATDSTYFLARVGCSAKAAISKNALTSHSKIMPKYNGNVQYIEDSISQMADVNKMFICFGMNDLTGSTPSQFTSDLQTLISRILSKKPDIHVYIISIPCVVSSVSSGRLNNSSINSANLLLQEICASNGWGFINLSEYLMDSNGALLSEYSADNYVHENNRAYAVWNKVLKNYAFMEITK